MPQTLQRIPRNGRGYIEHRLKVEAALPLHMVLIPGGTFTMGSPEAELERANTEGPQHQVSVPQFFMSRYPVTQAQWRAVAALPQSEQELNPAPSRFEGDNNPVEQVSWHESSEFCARLAKHTGLIYRLPSESEWEYACRAKTTTLFHCGGSISTEAANYNGGYTYADSSKGENRRKTTSVDQLDNANAFGLSDMHGNVWEWCQDHWHSNYDNAPTDGQAWLTDNDAATRVLRGGSWIYAPGNCRSASRDSYTPDFRNPYIGFRVSCVAPRILQ